MENPLYRIILIALLFFTKAAHSFEADTGFQFNSLPKKSSAELRVVWWNIMDGGELSTEIEKKEKHNPLQTNLESLTNPTQKPDFLILGEYSPNSVKPEIDQLLRSRYRHAIYIPNSDHFQDQGIFILTDLSMTIFTREVSWVNPDGTKKEITQYRDHWSKLSPISKTYFDRTFIAIQYQWMGENRYLLPFHAVDPWAALKASYPQKLSKYLTALEILNGTKNPLFYQLKEYLGVMKQICDPKKNKVLMIGDLNTPDSILGLIPIGYQFLTSQLNNDFKRGADYTFPTPSSSQTINKIKIDHALSSTNQNTKDAIRLPLRGSDHFPIAVTLE